MCAAFANAASSDTGPVTVWWTRYAGVPSIAASVSYCARLTIASIRVAIGGSHDRQTNRVQRLLVPLQRHVRGDGIPAA